MQKTEKYILDGLERKGALLFSLVDPLDYPSLDEAVRTAKGMCEGRSGRGEGVREGGARGFQEVKDG